MAVPPVVKAWVDEVARLTAPASIVWCDGSESERARLVSECLATGELIDEGAVELPVPASRVFDTGQVGVVNAGREILVVAPACR